MNVDGAYLGIGDVPAAMGDAEVTSTAYETSADVTLSVRVQPHGEVRVSRHALWLDTRSEVGAVGCQFGASLEANFAHAFEAVRARLEAAYDVSTTEAWGLVGASASARPNQCVCTEDGRPATWAPTQPRRPAANDAGGCVERGEAWFPCR